MRAIVSAVRYLAAAECAWRLLPNCFPPISTVRRYVCAWRDAGLCDATNALLVMNLREIEEREASPSTNVIDSLESIERSDAVKGFQVLPRRWIVERTFAWFVRCRCLTKDWENASAFSTARARIAPIHMRSSGTAAHCLG